MITVIRIRKRYGECSKAALSFTGQIIRAVLYLPFKTESLL